MHARACSNAAVLYDWPVFKFRAKVVRLVFHDGGWPSRVQHWAAIHAAVIALRAEMVMRRRAAASSRGGFWRAYERATA